MNILICNNNENLSYLMGKNLNEKYKGEYDCKYVSKANEFLDVIKDGKNKFDVLIMNIDKKDTSGIDLAYVAQKQYPNIKTIFTSDDVNLVEDIYVKIRPYAYIKKPINYDLLDFHLNKISKDISKNGEDFFTIVNRNTVAKIPYSDIVFFESQKRKLFIHTFEDNYAIYRKIDEVEKTAPDYFIRCHQSYLVNPYYTKGAITNNGFELITGQKIPISRSRLHDTQDIFFEWKKNKFD